MQGGLQTTLTFDRIEVRRILRQILQPRADRFDRSRHASDLVSGKIVHNDGIATIERRGQTLLDIRDEGRPVHWPSTTKGATIPSLRRPAMKVMVFQCPCGALPI